MGIEAVPASKSMAACHIISTPLEAHSQRHEDNVHDKPFGIMKQAVSQSIMCRFALQNGT